MLEYLLVPIIISCWILSLISFHWMLVQIVRRREEKDNWDDYKLCQQRINPITGRAELLVEKTFDGKKINWKWKDLINHYEQNRVPNKLLRPQGKYLGKEEEIPSDELVHAIRLIYNLILFRNDKEGFDDNEQLGDKFFKDMTDKYGSEYIGTVQYRLTPSKESTCCAYFLCFNQHTVGTKWCEAHQNKKD